MGSVAMACSLAATTAAAQADQGVLRGEVLDSVTGAAIEGAFVARRGASRGVLTDSQGRFSLDLPDDPPRVLRVRQLGYRDAEVTVVPEGPGGAVRIRLTPDPVLIEGLKVLAERFAERSRGVRGRADILDPSDLLKAPDGSAYDLLARVVPLARPCSPGSEALCAGLGRRVLSVCFDGHRVPAQFMEVELLGVDPRTLYRVEVFSMAREVRLYSRAYVERLLVAGMSLTPVAFGCDDLGPE